MVVPTAVIVVVVKIFDVAVVNIVVVFADVIAESFFQEMCT